MFYKQTTQPISPAPQRWRWGWQWLLALTLVALATMSALYLARAQGRQCRDIDLVTICFDKEDKTPGQVFTPERPISRYEGNITIARKGQAPYLKVVNQPGGGTENDAIILHALDGQPIGSILPPLSIRGGAATHWR